MIGAFFICAVLLLMLTQLLNREPPGPNEAPRNEFFENYASAVRNEFGEIADASTTRPEESKQRLEFWIAPPHSGGVLGVGLRLLNDAALFSRIFPGYGQELREDFHFWESYFRYPLDTSAYLGKHDIQISSFGCLSLLEKFGADALVIGNSEAGRGYVPEILAKATGVSRILFCPKAGGTLGTIDRIADIIEKRTRKDGKKLKFILWGLSYWNIASNQDLQAKDETKQVAEFHTFKKRENEFYIGGRELFPALTWDTFIPFTFQKWREQKEMNKAASAEHKPCSPSPARPFRQDESQEGFYFFRHDPNAPAAALAEAFSAKARPNYLRLKNISGKSCDPAANSAFKALGRVISKLDASAEATFVVMNPTTPLQTRTGPECLRASVARYLEAMASESVKVKTGGIDAYSLGWGDFLFPQATQKECYFIDPNHLNPGGAAKFTTSIAEWISENIQHARAI
jgi:hypothetical protein